MDPRITATLIGATSVLLAFILRDIAAWLIKENISHRRNTQSVFRNYSGPLLYSLESLFWRLNEVLDSPGRGAFLRERANYSQYAEYKKISTIYRIAVVVGWLRAYEKELSVLHSSRITRLKEVNLAILRFRSALADGATIEAKRLSGLIELWQMPKPDDQHMFEATAILVENQLKEFIHQNQVANAEQLEPEEQLNIPLRFSPVQ